MFKTLRKFARSTVAAPIIRHGLNALSILITGRPVTATGCPMVASKYDNKVAASDTSTDDKSKN